MQAEKALAELPKTANKSAGALQSSMSTDLNVEVRTSGKAGGLKMRTAQSGLIFVPPKGGGALK